jgi:hypothetical protein
MIVGEHKDCMFWSNGCKFDVLKRSTLHVILFMNVYLIKISNQLAVENFLSLLIGEIE